MGIIDPSTKGRLKQEADAIVQQAFLLIYAEMVACHTDVNPEKIRNIAVEAYRKALYAVEPLGLGRVTQITTGDTDE